MRAPFLECDGPVYHEQVTFVKRSMTNMFDDKYR